MCNNLKIRTKIFGVIMLIILSFSVVTVGNTFRIYNEGLSSVVRVKTTNSERLYEHFVQMDTITLSSTLDVLLESGEIQDLYLEKNREKLYEREEALFKKLKKEYDITHWYFIAPDGRVFLRMHDKTLFGDVVSRVTFLNAQKTGKKSSGLELGKTAFALRVVSPYYVGGKLVGYMELGKEINHFLTGMKGVSRSEFGIIVEKEFLKKKDWESSRKVLGVRDSWEDFFDDVYVGGTVDSPSNVCFQDTYISKIEAKEEVHASIVDDSAYGCGGFDIRDPNGRRVGTILSAIDITEEKKDAGRGIVVNLQYLLLLTVLILFAGWRLAVSLVHPIEKLAGVAKDISEGNTGVRAEALCHDEIGDLGRAFNAVVSKLESEKKDLERKVEERTQYYTRINKMMVDREVEMIKLKKQFSKNSGKEADNDKKIA